MIPINVFNLLEVIGLTCFSSFYGKRIRLIVIGDVTREILLCLRVIFELTSGREQNKNRQK